MTHLQKKAIEIADSLEKQIKLVDEELTHLMVLKIAISVAIPIAEYIKGRVPMHAGNLNSNWLAFDKAIEILNNRADDRLN